jgi:flagellar basal body rod protein FlgB
MNLTALVTDNITEILIKIVMFTQARQKVLVQNILNMHRPEFVPQELEEHEFGSLLDDAVDEHVRSRRLVLHDTDNIKFGESGAFEVRAVVDETGKDLLLEDQGRYLQRQITKLWENSLNQKVAAELLRQKEGTIPLDA